MNVARKLLLVAVLGLAIPSRIFACAACYGASDSPLATGMNYGILTLMCVVLSVLSVFVVCFVHIVRKGEAMHRAAVKRMEEL
jgi:ABC-type transport system involved in cytochrome c biogenesis permease component